MYPVLFQIGGFRLDTYSVIWLIALSTAILWSIRRLKIYGLDEDKSRSVMFWAFIMMLIGARSHEYIANIKFYLANPLEFFNLNRGSLSEAGALSGAFIMAFVMSLIKKVSFKKLCDVVAIPGMLALVIGRWGCFLNGCCVGRVTDFFAGVHFPFDQAGIFRHPVQIYYSLIAFVIMCILLLVEKKFIRSQKNYHSIIAPLALILYSAMRFFTVPFREYFSLNLLLRYDMTYKTVFIIALIGFIWLILSFITAVLRKRVHERNSKPE